MPDTINLIIFCIPLSYLNTYVFKTTQNIKSAQCINTRRVWQKELQMKELRLRLNLPL
jgi:hypothetical protein